MHFVIAPKRDFAEVGCYNEKQTYVNNINYKRQLSIWFMTLPETEYIHSFRTLPQYRS